MGKVWVLDTETKGTGAEMVPLEKVVDESRTGGHSVIVVPDRKRAPDEAPRSHGPRQFKVVDVMTGRVLAEDADARTTAELLSGVRR